MDSLVAAEVGLVAETSFRFGEVSFEIRFAPGHSPGSVCFYNEEEKYVISGDVLFQGSVGRTDLPGGDMGTLMGSIRSQLLTMPDEVIVYSGHGPLTTVGQERESNPYL
jgi:glyoxylase-like metal-dependent hydrolase (beta-lactamase superfamily II)